ncbi:MAG TPA: hypothetical protein VHO25_24430, partial [Polyangiaceae bacterium]|nr:hypothetical protein [Polyangiaceae bacterium]
QLQFLGVATRVYPKEEADELQTKRNLLRAKARLDEFRRTTLEGAQSLVPDLVAETSERSVGARLDEAIELFQRQLKELENSRNQASKKALTRQKYELEPLAKQRVAVVAALEKAHVSANDLAIRKNQLSEYRTNVTNEVAKLERAAVSSEVFSPLSVRSCPYCDQAVDPERAIVGSCFVCCQALPSGFQTSASGAKSRIGFEQQQLRAELTELQDLLGKLDKEHDTAERHVRKLKKELDVLEASLQPARDVFTALLPTGTLAINTRIGELRERLLHLRELRVNLSREDELEKDVQQLEGLLQTHSARPASSQVSRSEQAGRLSQGINEYLESLNADDPTRWIQGRVDIELSDRSPVLTIGGRPLSALGATSRILVLLGYHYALLKICKTQPSNYPGIALLDFPPTLADGETVAGQENYLVKPFISLCRGEKFLQLIVCGRVFEDLEGVRRIPLTEVWQSLEIQTGTPDKLPEESGSDGVLLRVGVVYHTGRTQIVVVLDHANTRRLGSVIPALGRHIEEGKTWKGNAILARWGGGEFEAKLGYNKDNKNAKFTIKKRAAPELWYYLDNKLRHATSRVDYSARFEVGGPGKLDVFQVNVSVPPRSSRKRSSR